MRISAGQPSISDEKSSISEGKSSISARKVAISARVALGTTRGTDARDTARGRTPRGDGACCEGRTPGNHAR